MKKYLYRITYEELDISHINKGYFYIYNKPKGILSFLLPWNFIGLASNEGEAHARINELKNQEAFTPVVKLIYEEK